MLNDMSSRILVFCLKFETGGKVSPKMYVFGPVYFWSSDDLRYLQF